MHSRMKDPLKYAELLLARKTRQIFKCSSESTPKRKIQKLNSQIRRLSKWIIDNYPYPSPTGEK